MKERLVDPDERGSDQAPIRVVVVADSPLVRAALTSRLSREQDVIALEKPENLPRAQAMSDRLDSFGPNVVIIEAVSSRAKQFESYIEEIHSLPSAPSVLVLVDELDSRLAAELVKAKADAIVLKSAPVKELIVAVRWAALGHSWVSPPLLQEVLALLHSPVASRAIATPLLEFSAREQEVLQLMVDGLSRQQIAQQLYLSVATVRTHMQVIMEKLGVHSSTEAVSKAHLAGLRPSEVHVRRNAK